MTFELDDAHDVENPKLTTSDVGEALTEPESSTSKQPEVPDEAPPESHLGYVNSDEKNHTSRENTSTSISSSTSQSARVTFSSQSESERDDEGRDPSIAEVATEEPSQSLSVDDHFLVSNEYERHNGASHPFHLRSQLSMKKDSKNANVTVFARHSVQPGKEHLFEEWIQELSQLQRDKFPGYQGLKVVKPAHCDSENEYVSIFEYENYDRLEDFMESADRRRMLEKTREFEAAPIEFTYHSLEYWFTDGEDTADAASGDPALRRFHKPPSKPKMVVVTFLLIWVQSHFYQLGLRQVPKLPPLGVQALSTFLIVLCTTYVAMPIVTKYILAWWLFPKR